MSWSVFAMEAAACYIGECRNPARDAKIAMVSASLYGFFIYVSLPLMLVVVLGSAMGMDPLMAFLAYTEVIFGAGTWVHWLDRAVERGLVKRQGKGCKSDPYYYWLPEREGKLYGKRDW